MLKRKRIDKFYPVLILTVLVLSLLIIFTIRGIYDVINLTIDTGEEKSSESLHVDTEKLEKANDAVLNKEPTLLDLVD